MLHDVKRHLPAEQVPAPFVKVQTLPNEPQFFGSVWKL